MIDGMIEDVSKDIRRWLGGLPMASTKEQVKLLELIAVNAEHVVTQIRKELEFERILGVFNYHGAKETKPFGAIPIDGRGVLVSGYTDSRGNYWNGSLLSREFITREVIARWGWAEMEIA